MGLVAEQGRHQESFCARSHQLSTFSDIYDEMVLMHADLQFLILNTVKKIKNNAQIKKSNLFGTQNNNGTQQVLQTVTQIKQNGL